MRFRNLQTKVTAMILDVNEYTKRNTLS
jgi:hypothetical protein